MREVGKFRGLRRAALAAAVLACAPLAGAQVILNVSVDAPEQVTPGSTAELLITVDRADASLSPDSDVTAIGIELGLPAGWKAERDADSNCAVGITDNQVAGVNSTIQVQGANQTYVDPPANTTCVALPPEGNVLEFFWIPDTGGDGDALPVSFPLIINASIVVPNTTGGCTPQIDAVATLRYRVLNNDESISTGIDSIPENCLDCPTNGGDANGDGSVDPADAQLAFEAFLQFPAALEALVPTCGDYCGNGDGVDPADAQGIFNTFLQLPNPCN